MWAINSYIVVFAALLFTWGVLGDRYGRKRIFVIGLLLFGVASALSAFAASPTQLIVFRGLMGIGAAAVLPVTLAIITVIFPSSERGRAVGLWAGAVGAAIAIGPILGGFLLEHFWWGSVFLVNVPVVILGVAGILALVPETRDPTPRGIDPIGVPISIVGLLMLVYGIVHGGDTRDWGSPGVLGWIVAGIVVLAVFVVYEIRSRHPSLDTALFRNADFSVALTAVSLTFFALMGSTFFLVFYLQVVRGLSPLQAGLCSIPVAVGQLLSAPFSATLVARFGARTVMTSGLTLVVMAFALLLFIEVETRCGSSCDVRAHRARHGRHRRAGDHADPGGVTPPRRGGLGRAEHDAPGRWRTRSRHPRIGAVDGVWQPGAGRGRCAARINCIGSVRLGRLDLRDRSAAGTRRCPYRGAGRCADRRRQRCLHRRDERRHHHRHRCPRHRCRRGVLPPAAACRSRSRTRARRPRGCNTGSPGMTMQVTEQALPARPPGRPRSEVADRAIVEATLELMADVGMSALTIEQVAAAAGVGKATIYRRWANKDALLVDALATLNDDLPDVNDVPLRDALVEVVDFVRRASTRNARRPAHAVSRR